MDMSESFPTAHVGVGGDGYLKAGAPSPREYDYTGRLRVKSGGAPRLGGVSDTTRELSVNASALELKIALEELVNIEAVDVSRHIVPNGQDDAGSTTYMVTFTHDLGDIPLLQYEAGSLDSAAISITEVQEGVTEVQTITTDADVGFVREVQSITTKSGGGNVLGSFKVKLPLDGFAVEIATDATANAADPPTGESVQEKLQMLDGVNQVSVVTRPVLAAAIRPPPTTHHPPPTTYHPPPTTHHPPPTTHSAHTTHPAR